MVVRFFNTVGPRQTGRYGMVLPNFVRQALAGEPITVYGTGQQSRCFCDVRESVEAVLRLVANDRAIGEVVNVGSDEELSIEGSRAVSEAARGERLRRSSSIPYDQAYEPGFEDMPRRVPALEKLEKLTGFRPGIPLNDIVDGVVAYFQDKANAAVGTAVGSGGSYPMAAKASAD